MTRDALLLMARRDQRHTALEEAVAPLEVLPVDLLTVMVDSKPEATSWELHGFVLAKERVTRYYRDGKEVWPSWVDTWGTFGCGGNYRELFIYTSDPRDASSYPMEPRRVPMASIRTDDREHATWYAVVSGNAVSAERWLKEHGYGRAFAGSATHVKVRVAEPDELAYVACP